MIKDKLNRINELESELEARVLNANGGIKYLKELVGMARQTVTTPAMHLMYVMKAIELLDTRLDADYQFCCQANRRNDDYDANNKYHKFSSVREIVDSRVYRAAKEFVMENKEEI